MPESCETNTRMGFRSEKNILFVLYNLYYDVLRVLKVSVIASEKA